MVVAEISGTDPDIGDTLGFDLVPGTGDDDNADFLVAGGHKWLASPMGTGPEGATTSTTARVLSDTGPRRGMDGKTKLITISDWMIAIRHGAG